MMSTSNSVLLQISLCFMATPAVRQNKKGHMMLWGAFVSICMCNLEDLKFARFCHIMDTSCGKTVLPVVSLSVVCICSHRLWAV